MIAAKPTMYSDVRFRSRLEARWAKFFDLIGWTWKYEPIDFDDWVPDFYIKFACGHSECSGSHEFYAEVKPYWSLKPFEGHPASLDFYGNRYGLDGTLLLGINPNVAHADFAHGSGGGIIDGPDIFEFWGKRTDIDLAWKEAGNSVQWRPNKK